LLDVLQGILRWALLLLLMLMLWLVLVVLLLFIVKSGALQFAMLSFFSFFSNHIEKSINIVVEVQRASFPFYINLTYGFYLLHQLQLNAGDSGIAFAVIKHLFMNILVHDFETL
jgi:hypothetical protein